MRREKRAKRNAFVCLTLRAPLSPASCDCDDANGTCGRHDVAADADAAADANSVAFVAAYSYLFGDFCCCCCCRLAAKWAAWHNNKCCRRSVFALVTHTPLFTTPTHMQWDVRRHCCIWRALDLQMRRKLCNWPWKRLLCVCVRVCVCVLYFSARAYVACWWFMAGQPIANWHEKSEIYLR